jgi:hypothetical protein
MSKATKDIKAKGESVVLKGGTAYIHRKYAGQKVIWEIPTQEE